LPIGVYQIIFANEESQIQLVQKFIKQ
jgi:hypothetical protein